MMIEGLERITFEAGKMGGQACIRGLRVPVVTVLKLVASGMSRAEILEDYPYLESADIDQSLAYAALLVEERVVVIPKAG